MAHNVFFNDTYVSSEYSFDTTRKSADIADSLVDAPHVTLADPSGHVGATNLILDEVHDPAYRLAVLTGDPIDLCESQGFPWDPNIPVMATAHSSGLVAAVDDVLVDGSPAAGSLSSGLHHARYDHGSGYCTFNGIAVAATRATHIGAERILVIDFDAHGGGGTRSILNDSIVTQIDVSTSPFDQWTPSNDSDDEYILADQTNYLDSISYLLVKAALLGTWDLVIYNAGMDPINTGINETTLETREEMVATWLAVNNYPAIYTLAGGYTWGNITRNDLVRLHRYTIDNMAAL